jgi:hypothetical protein
VRHLARGYLTQTTRASPLPRLESNWSPNRSGPDWKPQHRLDWITCAAPLTSGHAAIDVWCGVTERKRRTGSLSTLLRCR